MIVNPRELRQILTLQQTTEDQKIWMTSAQTGFPLERDEEEVNNIRDVQMGRHTARYLHPAISAYIADWEADLAYTGTQLPPLAQAAIDLENEWSQKYVMGTCLGSERWVSDAAQRDRGILRLAFSPDNGQRTGLGSNPTKIPTMGRKHTGLNRHHT